MLNKRQYRFISGFVDPFSLIIVGFFLLTVISGVAVVKNKDVSMNISKFAKMVSEESGIGKTSSTTKKTPTPTVFKMSPSSPTPNPTNQETGSGKTSLTTPITTPVNQETQVGKTSPPTSTPTPTPIDNQENQVGKISPPTPTQTPINQESGAGTTAKPTNIPTPTPTPINQQSQIGKTPKPIPSPTPFCYETLYADCINGCVPDIDGGKCKDPPKVCETTTCADSCAKGVRGYSGTCQNGICICSIQKTINGRNCSTDSECESGHCYETFSEYINRVGIGDYKTELTFESQKTCHALSKEENKEERQDEANLALAGVARGIYSTLWNPLSLGFTMAQGLQSGSDACNLNPESTECVLFLAGAIMGTPETNAGIQYFTEASSLYLQSSKPYLYLNGFWENSLNDTFSWADNYHLAPEAINNDVTDILYNPLSRIEIKNQPTQWFLRVSTDDQKLSNLVADLIERTGKINPTVEELSLALYERNLEMPDYFGPTGPYDNGIPEMRALLGIDGGDKKMLLGEAFSELPCSAGNVCYHNSAALQAAAAATDNETVLTAIKYGEEEMKHTIIQWQDKSTGLWMISDPGAGITTTVENYLNISSLDIGYHLPGTIFKTELIFAPK